MQASYDRLSATVCCPCVCAQVSLGVLRFICFISFRELPRRRMLGWGRRRVPHRPLLIAAGAMRKIGASEIGAASKFIFKVRDDRIAGRNTTKTVPRLPRRNFARRLLLGSIE